jgi:integrase
MGRRPTGTVEPRASSIRLKFTHLGKRQVESLDLAPTPANIKAAERLLGRIQAAIGAGIYQREDFFESASRASANPTFGEYAEQWLSTLTVEHGTLKHYQAAIRNVWVPALGNKLLPRVLPSDIKTVIAARAKVVKGKTVNNDLIPLRQALEAAVDDGLIAVNPTGKIKNLKHQKPTPDPFTSEEMEAILTDLKDRAPVQVWAYFEFAFLTGLRPSEIIAVKWGKVDWARSQVRIDTAKTYSREKGTKTGTIRDVDLTPRAIEALRTMKPFTFMKDMDCHIFANPATGRAWATDEYQRVTYFTPTLKRLGIRHRGAVQTRHTYATTGLMGGMNPAYIARQMGHANTAMLFTVYSRWIDSADGGREADKLAALHRPKTSPNCPQVVSED